MSHVTEAPSAVLFVSFTRSRSLTSTTCDTWQRRPARRQMCSGCGARRGPPRAATAADGDDVHDLENVHRGIARRRSTYRPPTLGGRTGVAVAGSASTSGSVAHSA